MNSWHERRVDRPRVQGQKRFTCRPDKISAFASSANMNSPCVIARLAGGLGNQLFMYAFNMRKELNHTLP